MKPKQLRKLLSSILIVLLLFSNISPVIAVESQNSEPPTNALQEYLDQCLPYYLLGQGLDPTDDSYSLSQGLEIANSSDPNKRVYYLFCDDVCMGELIVTLNGTEYVSSFMYGPLPAVTAAYRSGAPVSLYIEGDSCYLWTPDGTTQMSGPKTSISSTVSTTSTSLNLSPTALTTTSLSLTLPAQVYGTSVGERRQLNVPYVENDTSPDTGDGLCWAACVASIGAYSTNTSPLTAIEMYEWVKDEVFVLGYTYPIGIPEFEVPALELFGLNCYAVTSGLEYSDVVLFMDNDMPISAGIKNSSNTYRHSVVICGYQVLPNTPMIYLMDPNTENIISTVIPAGSTSFTYVTSYCTYTEWYKFIAEDLYY